MNDENNKTNEQKQNEHEQFVADKLNELIMEFEKNETPGIVVAAGFFDLSRQFLGHYFEPEELPVVLENLGFSGLDYTNATHDSKPIIPDTTRH